MFDHEEKELLRQILAVLEDIFTFVRPRYSATLTLKGEKAMPATILVGGTASSLWQEWSGPNGTGQVLPTAGAVTYSSGNPAIATVDPNSGTVTGVAIGSTSISGVDAANSLTASDTITVTEVAQSATLTLSANAAAPVAAAKKA